MSAKRDIIMRQCSIALEEHLSASIRTLDSKFGKGYAKHNPHILQSLIDASILEYTIANNQDMLKCVVQELMQINVTLAQIEAKI